MGPELLTAILSVLFYCHNKSLESKKHMCNSEIVPVPHPPRNSIIDNGTQNVAISEEILEKISTSNNLFQEDVLATGIMNFICANIEINQQTILMLQNRCKNQNRLISIYDMFPKEDFIKNEGDKKSHQEQLERNCRSFSLKLEAEMLDIKFRDGDCLFRSIIRQLRVSCGKSPAAYQRCLHLLLQLSLSSENEDILRLRTLFVDELKSSNKYSDFITDENIETFYQPGVFASGTGDLIVVVCADILQIPIVVITSAIDAFVHPFIPTPCAESENSVLFLAYNSSESHYCNTIEDREATATESCSCHHRPEGIACSDTKAYKSRCQCKKNNRRCNEKCSCMNSCGNKETQDSSSSDQSCRCGMNTDKLSCADVEGQRKTKCPCFRQKTKCTAKCNCKNCINGNEHRLSDKKEPKVKQMRSPRKRSYERPRTSKYLKESGSELSEGHWSDLETVTLILLSKLLKKTGLPLTDDHHRSLYDLVYQYICKQKLWNKIPIRRKSLKQVAFKLRHIELKYF